MFAAVLQLIAVILSLFLTFSVAPQLNMWQIHFVMSKILRYSKTSFPNVGATLNNRKVKQLR